MEKKNVLNGNELIAEFIGLQFINGDNKIYESIISFEPILNEYYEGFVHKDQLLFHKSWDWLMPSVRKIVELCIEDDDLFMSEFYTSILQIIPLANIKDSHKVVVEFIKWYNENNKN